MKNSVHVQILLLQTSNIAEIDNFFLQRGYSELRINVHIPFIILTNGTNGIKYPWTHLLDQTTDIPPLTINTFSAHT